jgi:hypothetical protein
LLYFSKMREYLAGVVPGPTALCRAALEGPHIRFGSADIEPEFWDDYAGCCTALQTLSSRIGLRKLSQFPSSQHEM